MGASQEEGRAYARARWENGREWKGGQCGPGQSGRGPRKEVGLEGKTSVQHETLSESLCLEPREAFKEMGAGSDIQGTLDV